MAGLQAKDGKKPRAFQRSSIDLDRSVTREWRTVPWDDIYEGDIVADQGIVLSREEDERFLRHTLASRFVQTPKQETIASEGQDLRMFDVFAFVKVRG